MPARKIVGKLQVRSVSVIGLGKLGMPLAACIANKGFKVYGIDRNLHIVRQLNRGRTNLVEPHLNKLIHMNRERLRASRNYDEAISNSQITFIAVETPAERNGNFSLRYVRQACESIGRSLSKKHSYHLVVVTSTVLPGSVEQEVKPIIERYSHMQCGKDFGLCYNPEFIALGSAIHDLTHPDFVLIGESDQKAGDLLASFYKRFCDNNPPMARMNFVNAEITKLAVNTYVTTKITFGNMLARICEKIPGAHVDVITSALGQDSRIGNKYLKGAIGYGGPCFPRDNLALSYLARKLNLRASLAEATDRSNRKEVSHIAQMVKANSNVRKNVGILGLSYKPNTDVVEESQGLLLAQSLSRDGYKVIVYDPVAMTNAKKILGTKLRFAHSLKECIKKTDVIVITTPWDEFHRLPINILKRSKNPKTIIDCWRILDSRICDGILTYVPLGVSLNGATELLT